MSLTVFLNTTVYYRQFPLKWRIFVIFCGSQTHLPGLIEERVVIDELFFSNGGVNTAWAWKLVSDIGIAKAIPPPIPRRGRTWVTVYIPSTRKAEGNSDWYSRAGSSLPLVRIEMGWIVWKADLHDRILTIESLTHERLSSQLRSWEYIHARIFHCDARITISELLCSNGKLQKLKT